MTPQEAFITRLRRHRERSRISLDEIVSETRIKREQLQAFEQGDLTTWPRGIYARAWVRAYASVVGLDPIDTVEEFCKLFPQGDRRAQGTFREFATIIAHPSIYKDEFEPTPEGDRRRRTPKMNVIARSGWREYFARVARAVGFARQTRSAREVRTMRAN
jgi:helix-turn-helix protein